MAKEEQSMINYNKLKLAHELAGKLNERLDITVCYFVADCQPTFVLDHADFKNNVTSCNLDDLIAKLKRLTKTEPRYRIRQKVWMTVINGFKLDIDSARITWSRFNNGQNEYTIDSCPNDFYILESELHPTREDLIDAQIKYWESLKPTTNYQQPTN